MYTTNDMVSSTNRRRCYTTASTIHRIVITHMRPQGSFKEGPKPFSKRFLPPFNCSQAAQRIDLRACKILRDGIFNILGTGLSACDMSLLMFLIAAKWLGEYNAMK